MDQTLNPAWQFKTQFEMEGGEWKGQQISRGKRRVELAKQDLELGVTPNAKNLDNAN